MKTIVVSKKSKFRFFPPLRPWVNALRARTGVSALEFGLIAPVLFMLVLGILQFGIVLNNYVALTDSVRVGARVLAASRSSTTPWSAATNAVYGSAPNLVKASISLTASVNGTACSADSSCQTALTGATGTAAFLKATYPCDLTVFGVNYAPTCTLTAATTERVE